MSPTTKLPTVAVPLRYPAIGSGLRSAPVFIRLAVARVVWLRPRAS